jgi:hypothetical protein
MQRSRHFAMQDLGRTTDGSVDWAPVRPGRGGWREALLEADAAWARLLERIQDDERKALDERPPRP